MKKIIFTVLGVATSFATIQTIKKYRENKEYYKDNGLRSQELDNYLTIVGQLKLLTKRIDLLGKEIKQIKGIAVKGGKR